MTELNYKNVLLLDDDSNGLIPYVPLATETTAGLVKPDGTTVTIVNGTISAQGGVDINTVLETMYPVGSVYIDMSSVCSLQTLYSFGTWSTIISSVITSVSGSATASSKSASVSVRGNGYTLGMYDGTYSIGMFETQAGGITRVVVSSTAYNMASGSDAQSGGSKVAGKNLGVVTSGQSGLTGSVTIPSYTYSVTNSSVTVYFHQRTA